MLKSLRRYYWLTQIFIKKHSRLILNTTVIIVSILTVIILFARYVPTPKNTLKIARVGKYNLTTIPHDILSRVGEGLLSISDAGEVTPVLADSYSVSSNGLTYTFNLKNKSWHDGTKVKGSDLNYSFADVESAHTDTTLTFTLKEPFAPFLQTMTKPTLKNNTLGTGSMRLTNYKTVSGNLQSLTLEDDNTRLLYKFYPTESSAITAYKIGEVNYLENLSTVPLELSTDHASIVTTSAGDKIAALFINNADSILSSKTTRQGLAYAIPDKSFGKVRALSPISSSSWAYNDLVKDYAFDEARAKTLFGQDVADPSSLKLELKTMLAYLDVAESIADSWRRVLGIQVDVKVVSTTSSDYQLILADFIPPRDPDQYSLWHSTQPTNFTKYSNLKVDKLLEDGRRTLDMSLRREIYADFQRFLLEDSPAIFLFETETYAISRKPLFN